TLERNCLPSQVIRIPQPVPALVMARRDSLRRYDEGVVATGENVRANRRMRLHDRHLFACQRSHLVQDRRRDGDLADVVNWRRAANEIDTLSRLAEELGQLARQLA